MSDIQPLYLVMVESDTNHNKYYRMIPNGSFFNVEYGRVGNDYVATDSYSIDLWDKKLKEKLKKGYVDQTRLVAEVVGKKRDNTYAEIMSKSIAQIVERLQAMAKQAIRDNYTISSSKVTQTMIDEAQGLINYLNVANDWEAFNITLVNLFRTIPRKMDKVANYLAHSNNDIAKILQREQDLLDVMRGQVVQQSAMDIDEPVTSVEQKQSILDALGLQMFEVSDADTYPIKQLLGGLSNKFNCAWKVINNKTQKAFDGFINQSGITEKKLLWHGSRNENWWSIINTGLILRPNAVISGKMFGYGIYFAPSAQKSFGYTSYSGSYWAGGNSNVAFMSLFDVAYGKPYDVHQFDSKYYNFDAKALEANCPGAHCLHAHAGRMLHNDEIIVYKEEQLTIKYLVELK